MEEIKEILEKISKMIFSLIWMVIIFGGSILLVDWVITKLLIRFG